MGILEAAIANFICTGRKTQRPDALYDTDIRDVLVRMVVALAVFAAVITGLQISSSHDTDRQTVADRMGSVQAW
jgi:hypothetical protein